MSLSKVLKLTGVMVVLIAQTLFVSGQKTSIWKISKDGRTSYLGGTVHILKASDFPLPGKYEELYEKCDKLVFEADVTAVQDPQVIQSMMSEMMYADGRTLKTELNKKNYKKVKKLAKANGLPMLALDQMKPGMLMTTFSVMELQKSGVSESGVDPYFQNMVKEDKENPKPIEYFETPEFQLNMLANMGMDDPNKYVKYSLKEMKKPTSDFSEMTAAWKTGDSKVFEDIITQMKEDDPGQYNVLLKKRNENWMPMIKEYLEDDPMEFIMVGAAHLFGEDGLLNLLEKAGYTVEQI